MFGLGRKQNPLAPRLDAIRKDGIEPKAEKRIVKYEKNTGLSLLDKTGKLVFCDQKGAYLSLLLLGHEICKIAHTSSFFYKVSVDEIEFWKPLCRQNSITPSARHTWKQAYLIQSGIAIGHCKPERIQRCLQNTYQLTSLAVSRGIAISAHAHPDPKPGQTSQGAHARSWHLSQDRFRGLLKGSSHQISCVVAGQTTVFAGTKNGAILAWDIASELPMNYQVPSISERGYYKLSIGSPLEIVEQYLEAAQRSKARAALSELGWNFEGAIDGRYKVMSSSVITKMTIINEAMGSLCIGNKDGRIVLYNTPVDARECATAHRREITGIVHWQKRDKNYLITSSDDNDPWHSLQITLLSTFQSFPISNVSSGQYIQDLQVSGDALYALTCNSFPASDHHGGFTRARNILEVRNLNEHMFWTGSPSKYELVLESAARTCLFVSKIAVHGQVIMFSTLMDKGAHVPPGPGSSKGAEKRETKDSKRSTSHSVASISGPHQPKPLKRPDRERYVGAIVFATLKDLSSASAALVQSSLRTFSIYRDPYREKEAANLSLRLPKIPLEIPADPGLSGFTSTFTGLPTPTTLICDRSGCLALGAQKSKELLFVRF